MRLPRLSITLAVLAATHLSAVERLDCAGTWRLALDRDDQGVQERWFASTLNRSGSYTTVTLPGSLAVQGIGDPVSPTTTWTANVDPTGWYTKPVYAPYRTAGNVKMSCWLTPDTTWKAPAWYQRDIDIPADWQGQRVELTLDRAHISTQAWIDDQALGYRDSLSTAHRYDLGTTLTPGRHRLTLRVDNRLQVVNIGHNSHSISDHTQGNWNGVIGGIALATTSPVWISHLRTDPDRTTRTITVHGLLGNAGAPAGQGTVGITVRGPGVNVTVPPVAVTWQADGGHFTVAVPCGPDAQDWDEFHPVLYAVEAEIDGNPNAHHRCATTCGFRTIATQDGRLVLNDHPLFLRGTLECCIFPKTGHPPMEADAWRRILTIARDHGLNHLRFHSWCPPEVAFEVADAMGFYYQIESASWAFESTTLGDGKPIDAWVQAETQRILEAYGNHPSFLLMAYGNEPYGPNHKRYLAEWLGSCRAADPRRLYSGASGWPQIPENEFHVTSAPRIQAWAQGLKSRINAAPPETTTDYRAILAQWKVPVITHEIGQWCAFPNLEERAKYTGHLKAKNFDIFADFLAKAGMADQAHDFLIASGKLQTLCYKEDLEASFRTPGLGGFQLLDLHDFPGQGSALVGVLDAFWESKGYVTPKEYRRFCNATVPLARLSKRVFTTDESLQATIEVSHFGAAPLVQVTPEWRLVDDDDMDGGRTVISGTLPTQDIPLGNGTNLGAVTLPLEHIAAPHRYRLEVNIFGLGTDAVNDWDVWVYPAHVAFTGVLGRANCRYGVDADHLSPEITVTDVLDDHAANMLAAGGRVLWKVPPHHVRTPDAGPIALGFSSIFWNTSFTEGQAPHTLGLLCNPQHPLFAQFPTDPWSNWQWWYLMHAASPLLLDGLPLGLRPIVQIVPDWFAPHRIGLVVEARVGAGRLLITSIPIENPQDPVTRQFCHALSTYMASAQFAPTIDLSLDQARSFCAEPALKRLGATIQADSATPDHAANLLMDGDEATWWQAANGAPQTLTLTLPTPATVSGLIMTPRQGSSSGRIKDFAVYTSQDGTAWQEIATGQHKNKDRGPTVKFSKSFNTKLLRLEIRTTHDDAPPALAEVILETIP